MSEGALLMKSNGALAKECCCVVLDNIFSLESGGTDIITNDFNFPSSAGTLKLWVKIHLNTEIVVCSSGSKVFGISYNNGNIILLVQDAGGDILNTFHAWESDEEWHHIAFTWSGTTAKLYIDTVLVETYSSLPRAFPDAAGDLHCFTVAEADQNLFDELVILDNAQATITDSIPDVSSGYLGLYHFDEEDALLAPDSSGLDHDMTLDGATARSVDLPTP